MNQEQIENGMKCCSEFLCGECPYKEYDELICSHVLLCDVIKLYFNKIEE